MEIMRVPFSYQEWGPGVRSLSVTMLCIATTLVNFLLLPGERNHDLENIFSRIPCFSVVNIGD
jgi:hypothetical protein